MKVICVLNSSTSRYEWLDPSIKKVCIHGIIVQHAVSN